jgi:FPC/CPF motif-containing protein YcgG
MPHEAVGPEDAFVAAATGRCSGGCRCRPPSPSGRVFGVSEDDTLYTCDPSGAASEPGPAAHAVLGALRGFVEHSNYPCVGAKAALKRRSYRLGIYGELGGEREARELVDDLAWFGEAAPTIDDTAATFIAVFRGPSFDDARGFEGALWRHLQRAHEHDARCSGWDPAVSSDPADPEFSFSIGGSAFFVIGMSPVALREARRFPFPALVFNLHGQFEALREAGKYEPMKRTIREREERLEGRPNPTLSDFGATSEARQYAGVPHHRGWTPPFRAGGCPVRGATRGKDD